MWTAKVTTHPKYYETYLQELKEDWSKTLATRMYFWKP
jgi:hypothetical protein